MSGADIFRMPVLELGVVETFKAGADVGEASEHDAVIFIGDGDFTDASFSIDCFEAQKIAEHIVTASNSYADLVAERDALRDDRDLYMRAATRVEYERDALRTALEEIAADHKTYRGHGDYDEGPHTADVCQQIARAALSPSHQREEG